MKEHKNWENIDLYPVITPEFCAGRSPLYVLDEIMKAGVKAVQLRIKNSNDAEYLDTALKFREITSKYDALLIIDDRIDIALASDADGVHLGQEDIPLKYALKTANLIYGISTHSEQEALRAETEGATYINIGPIFKTGTKKTPMPYLGPEILEQIPPKINIPFTVMGGIKMHNIEEVLKRGAKTVAMVTEITEAENIRKTTENLRKIILKYRNR